MNTHSIDLTGYCARSHGSSNICLGTAGSHGNEQLQVTQGEGWEGLTVQVVFHPSKVAVQLPANGLLDVPWEATAQPLTMMQGRIVFQGFDQDRLVNSTDLAYTVSSHSPALGREEEPYTPGIVEGVLNQMAADKDAILQAAQQAGQAKEAAAASAANAQQSAGAAITSAGQAAGSAAAAGETLTQVQTAETEALDKIAALTSALPTVSSDAAWQSITVSPDGTGYNLAALAPIEATIRPTVTGNPAVCESSAAWGLQGLKIYGKSFQDGTPSPENPLPIIGAGEGKSVEIDVGNGQFLPAKIGDTILSDDKTVSCTVSENGLELACSANATTGGISDVYFVGANNAGSISGYQKFLAPGRYTIRISDNKFVSAYLSKWNGSSGDFVAVLTSGEKTFDVDDQSYYRVFLRQQNAGQQYAATIKVTICLENAKVGWIPYQSQPLILSLPNSLPGIPVESGGNFTDGTGRQWFADEINFGAGQHTQNCGSATFDGSADENWQIETVTNPALARFSVSVPDLALSPAGMCNRLPWIIVPTTGAQTEQIGGNTAQSRLHVIVSVSRLSENTVHGFKEWLSQNPLQVVYQLADAIETDISTEELAACRALTTYAGTTVVSTTEPAAGLEVGYVMDSNKYRESVDKRLAALEAAQAGI